MKTRGRLLLGWNASRLAVLGLALGAIACESDHERYEGHLERAEALLRTADPGPAAAVLELENARQLQPDNPDIYYRLAQALRAKRHLPDAIAYYEETLQRDPDHVEAAAELARLLRDRDPERARALVDHAVERASTSGLPLAVRAELALDRGDRDAALVDARQSVALAPEASLGYWVLAEVHYERALAALRAGRPIDPRANQKGREALERYAELSRDVDPWSALPPLARFLVLEPRYQQEAQATWRRLMDETDPDKAPPYIARRGAQAALDLGREWRNDDYRQEALERLVELSPKHIGYWDELAGLREATEGSGKETLEALIASNPKNPEAHLRYVSYLRATEGRSAAMAYLREHAQDDELGPDILGALIELHDQAGEIDEAQNVREQLIEDYPSHPVTLWVQGREALARGETATASHLLGSLVEEWDHAEAASLLAHAALARRNYPRALDAIARAIEIDTSQRSALLPLRAYAFAQTDQCERAIDAYARLYWDQHLEADDKITFARCLYTSDDAARGRQLLLEAIREGDPQHKALFELVRREGANPALKDAIRQRLQAAHAVDPQNLLVATHLSDVDRERGQHEKALARLEAFGDRARQDPEARLLRARILAEKGDLAAARPELEALFRARPYLKGILPLLVSAQLEANDTAAALATLKRGERYSLLGPDRYVLYASLLLDQGDRSGALGALEKAYLGGIQDPQVITQLALLELREGNDPIQATHFAQLAVNWSGRSPEALNTMGLVLLERNLPESAVAILEEALVTAEGRGDPALQAGTHYRLALALDRSGQPDKAIPHFERAHALDARIPAGPPAETETAP